MAALHGKPLRSWVRQDHPAYLMVCLFVLLLVHPVVEDRPFASLVLNGLFSLVLVTSVLSVLASRRLLVAVVCTGVPGVLLDWLGGVVDFSVPVLQAVTALQAAFWLLMVVVLLRGVMTSGQVTIGTLCRAVSGYLLLGLAWAAIYRGVASGDANALPALMDKGRWDFVYFSFTTLTTLGYGDIAPASPLARSLAMLEAIIGPLYLTILVARLVALYGREGK